MLSNLLSTVRFIILFHYVHHHLLIADKMDNPILAVIIMKGIQVCSKGDSPSPRGNNSENGKIH
jgi:hypothetical protein